MNFYQRIWFFRKFEIHHIRILCVQSSSCRWAHTVVGKRSSEQVVNTGNITQFCTTRQCCCVAWCHSGYVAKQWLVGMATRYHRDGCQQVVSSSTNMEREAARRKGTYAPHCALWSYYVTRGLFRIRERGVRTIRKCGAFTVILFQHFFSFDYKTTRTRMYMYTEHQTRCTRHYICSHFEAWRIYGESS